jgi:hypothetical protein
MISHEGAKCARKPKRSHCVPCEAVGRLPLQRPRTPLLQVLAFTNGDRAVNGIVRQLWATI